MVDALAQGPLGRRGALHGATSKIAPPVTRRGSVPRRFLLDRMRTLETCPVLSVVAPAGYGKTTLLRQYAGDDDRPVAWLTLDQHDNDPAVLLTYLAFAADRIVPVDPAVISALASPRHTTAAIAGRLLSDMEGVAGPAVLVVDDIHVLEDGDARDAFTDLMMRLPPSWQIVAASRHDLPLPVARLRAEGRIGEFGLTDLAMDDGDAGRLLAATGVDVAPERVTALNRRVEGWPAALYLAALAMAADPSLDPAAEWPVGKDRFVVDYIRSEVLSGLSGRERRLLMRLSVLDTLSGPLCDAVLAETGSTDRLAAWERSNMLVVSLDHERHWYRIHHVLRNMLRGELERTEPGGVTELRRRAADWYEREGLPHLAIEQAMAGEDAPRVARLAETWAQRYYQRGRASTALHWLQWIDERGLVQEYPKLAVMGALIHAIDGRPAAADRWLDGVERTLHDTPDAALEGRLAVLQALACRKGVHAARERAETAVRLLRPDDPFRGLSLLVLGVMCMLTDQPETAVTVLCEAVDVCEDANAVPSLAVALAYRSLLALRTGHADDAQRLAERANRHVDGAGLAEYGIAAFVFAVVARVHIERGDAEGARPALTRAQRLHPYLSHSTPWYTVQTRVELARCRTALTDVAGARTVLREAVDVRRRRPDLGVLDDEIRELQQVLSDLHANMAGATALTSAELRLLPLLSTHLTFREIGQRLFISPNTVKTQAIAIYRKLGVSSRGEAVDAARRLGLLPE